MVRTKKRFRVELWAFKGSCILCSALSAGAGWGWLPLGTAFGLQKCAIRAFYRFSVSGI